MHLPRNRNTLKSLVPDRNNEGWRGLERRASAPRSARFNDSTVQRFNVRIFHFFIFHVRIGTHGVGQKLSNPKNKFSGKVRISGLKLQKIKRRKTSTSSTTLSLNYYAVKAH